MSSNLFVPKNFKRDYCYFPSSEEIKAISNQDIENYLVSVNRSEAVPFLATMIRWANYLLRSDPEAKNKAQELATKVAQLAIGITSRYTEEEWNQMDSFCRRIVMESGLLPHVVFELTLNASKEAYELFHEAVLKEKG